MKIRKKQGFTLAELLVCLALMAIIATILIPTIAQLRPNKHKGMFKKAYTITERVVYELVNDDILYPTTSDKYGLDQTSLIEYNGVEYGSNTAADDDAKSKFCKLFAEKVNTIAGVTECGIDPSYDAPSLVTTDGVKWVMPMVTFPDELYYDIKVDVNGEKAPNCEDGAEGCSDPDRFVIKIRRDGKMKVDTAKAKEYLEQVDLIKR